MGKKLMKFDLDKTQVKMKEILNKEFVEIEVYAISDAYPNRNNSAFTLSSMKEALATFANKPILGAWDVAVGDFKGHNGNLEYDEELEDIYYDYTQPGCETPLGIIRESDSVQIVYDEERKENWIVVNAVLWSRYAYNQIKKLLRKNGRSKISVEVEFEKWHEDSDGIIVVDKFNFTGLTILGQENGKPIEEGIENAHLNVLELLNNSLFQRKQRCLSFAYEQYDKAMSNNKVETPNEGTPSAKDSNNKFDNTSIVNENPDKEIQMDDTNQEGGEKDSMLMNVKRQLLYEALPKDGDYWINDFSDDMVFFDEWDNNNRYISYRAPYTITENEDGTYIATIDMESKEKVILTWQTYSENPETNKVDEFAEGEVCPDCGQNPCVCENKKGCEAEDDSNDSDDKDDKDDDSDIDDDKVDESCGGKSEEDCKMSAETSEQNPKSQEEFEIDNKAVDPNAEPEINVDGKTMGEIIEDSTQSISAPPVQTEPGALGEANAAVEGDMPGAEAAVIDGENIDPDKAASAPDASDTDVQVEQPDDSAKSQMSEAQQNYVSTVELNGEELDVNALFEKYNELQEKYNALSEEVKVNKANELANFGADFINSDEFVDEENKANFVAEVEEKCKAFELTTEEEVTKFAKNLLAMYYYEHQNAHKGGAEFSVTINKPTHSDDASKKPMASLNEAIDKLNRI